MGCTPLIRYAVGIGEVGLSLVTMLHENMAGDVRCLDRR